VIIERVAKPPCYDKKINSLLNFKEFNND